MGNLSSAEVVRRIAGERGRTKLTRASFPPIGPCRRLVCTAGLATSNLTVSNFDSGPEGSDGMLYMLPTASYYLCSLQRLAHPDYQARRSIEGAPMCAIIPVAV